MDKIDALVKACTIIYPAPLYPKNLGFDPKLLKKVVEE